MQEFEKHGINYSLVSHEILDLGGGSKLNDKPPPARFYEVMTYEGVYRDSGGVVTGSSLAIRHRPLGLSKGHGDSPEYFWGASCKKDIYGGQPDRAWLSVADPNYSGACGDLRLEEDFKGRGIGSFLTRKIGSWLLNNHPNAMLHPIHLTEDDASDEENKLRRNRMYESIGIPIEYSDIVLQASGRSACGTVGQLISGSKLAAAINNFPILTPAAHANLLVKEEAAAAAAKAAEAARAKSGLVGMLREWFR